MRSKKPDQVSAFDKAEFNWPVKDLEDPFPAGHPPDPLDQTDIPEQVENEEVPSVTSSGRVAGEQ